MTKQQQIEKLEDLVKCLNVYERYLLRNGIERTMVEYPLLTRSQVTSDFCELKAECKRVLREEENG